MTERYVALGSSMAAGPGIPPRDKKAPLRAARSAANYPHLVARRIGLDLVDVTYSGATTAHVLTDRQNDEPPQVNALGRRVAASLERLTSEAVAETRCEVVRASDASREHHAWSADPWTTKPSRFGVPIPGRPFPSHPNAAGMRAVADLVTECFGRL